jgi:hypothetical protein
MQDGDTVLMGMVEEGAGTPVGTEHPSRHGDRQPRNRRLGFLKKMPIFFERNKNKSKRDSKN